MGCRSREKIATRMFAVLDRGESPLPAQRIGSFELRVRVLSEMCTAHPFQGWGRWSNGPKVTLTLAKPIKGRLELIIVIVAFGRNVGKQSPVNIGRMYRETADSLYARHFAMRQRQVIAISATRG